MNFSQIWKWQSVRVKWVFDLKPIRPQVTRSTKNRSVFGRNFGLAISRLPFGPGRKTGYLDLSTGQTLFISGIKIFQKSFSGCQIWYNQSRQKNRNPKLNNFWIIFSISEGPVSDRVSVHRWPRYLAPYRGIMWYKIVQINFWAGSTFLSLLPQIGECSPLNIIVHRWTLFVQRWTLFVQRWTLLFNDEQ